MPEPRDCADATDAGSTPSTSLPPLNKRRWINPKSLPTRMAITALDLDTTKNCNLRCIYCFKGETVRPGANRMSLEVAMAAVDWLIEASMDVEQLWVNLMGGEPLPAWSTVRLLVPYAKVRAGRAGKAVQFGTTTNLTLLNDEIAAFAERWGMGWHCSIDGPPSVQDVQRPGVGGRPSSDRAERGVPLVLAQRPGACARATVTPEAADKVFESLRYFEGLGFKEFAFAVADEKRWEKSHLDAWDKQWRRVAEYWVQRYRDANPISVAAIDYFIEQHAKGPEHRQYFSCGAGRGTVMVDHRGDMWPCHRFDGADQESGSGGAWRFGNIFQPGFNDSLHQALLERDWLACRMEACESCSCERLCAGGCPASNLSTTGSIYRQDDTSCETARIMHRHAIAAHDVLKAEANAKFLEKFYPPAKEDETKTGEGGP